MLGRPASPVRGHGSRTPTRPGWTGCGCPVHCPTQVLAGRAQSPTATKGGPGVSAGSVTWPSVCNHCPLGLLWKFLGACVPGRQCCTHSAQIYRPGGRPRPSVAAAPRGGGETGDDSEDGGHRGPTEMWAPRWGGARATPCRGGHWGAELREWRAGAAASWTPDASQGAVEEKPCFPSRSRGQIKPERGPCPVPPCGSG